ncbi:MAG: TrkA family potassium uptake protein [Saprospiraceae bacterium]
MKFIVLGLGNFGSELSIKLTELGHEVIGVDSNMKRVELLQDSITHTICMDTTDQSAVKSLPIKNSDVVIICIGEDTGASLISTAMIKQLKPKRLIARAINPAHQNVMEAMGIDEIIHPEADTAYRLAKRLDIGSIIDSFTLDDQYKVIEAKIPKGFVGKTIHEVNFQKEYRINIVTIIRNKTRKNNLDQEQIFHEILGVVPPETKLEAGDLLVVFGKIDDIDRMLRE